MVVNSEDGRALRSFIKMKIKRVRAVERVLPETLASELPPETVQFSSKLANIKSRENDDTLSELTDGTGFLAKMSFSEPKYTGHYAFCGLGFYFNGQPYAANINHIYGRGLHAGYVPVSTTKDYWFICYNSPSPAAKVVPAGDAWHPMIPNLGQGACCALEDLMILEEVS
ncbi:hypothetical protein V6N13_133853 [Hibiscus sabdariffa]